MSHEGKIILPTLHHVKSRAISDYTFSDHAQGWDDCLDAVMEALDNAGIPYVIPHHITAVEAKAWE